jgi:hypothetical protein
MKYAIEMDSVGIMYLAVSMKICAGFQTVLRFGLNSLRGCNVGITNGGDLRSNH